jgi:hypothetical protein
VGEDAVEFYKYFPRGKYVLWSENMVIVSSNLGYEVVTIFT